MSDFPAALKARIEEKGLSAADASAAIGVSAPSLRAALSGGSFPNARSLAKYASFLGRSEEETKALIAVSKPAPGEKKAKKEKKEKKEKPAKAAKGKPGRKPGAKAAKAAKAPKGKPGRKAGGKKGGSASDALAAISAALKQAESLAGDSLAVAVHNLGAVPRKLIEGILKTIG
jgi:transcriptional regulator with XRE-family HTH domain